MPVVTTAVVLITVAVFPSLSTGATRVSMVGSQLTIEDTSGSAQGIQVVGGTAMTPMLMVNDTAAGAAMLAGDGCMVMLGGGVECLSPAGSLSLLVTLGAGDDTFDSRGIAAPVTVDAGAARIRSSPARALTCSRVATVATPHRREQATTCCNFETPARTRARTAGAGPIRSSST